MSRRGRTYAERRIAEGMVRDGVLGWKHPTTCACWPCFNRRDRERSVNSYWHATTNEARELAARIPLGDKVVDL